VKLWSVTTFQASHISRHYQAPSGTRPAVAEAHLRLLQAADQSCCCSARPSVIAVLPPTAGRSHPIELLFCRHHYRESRSQLAAAGAIVFSSRGALIGNADPVSL
jgi:hypothetical protein